MEYGPIVRLDNPFPLSDSRTKPLAMVEGDLGQGVARLENRGVLPYSARLKQSHVPIVTDTLHSPWLSRKSAACPDLGMLT